MCIRDSYYCCYYCYNQGEIFAVTEVPATVHVPATSEDTAEQKVSESSPQPVVATHRTDAYSTMKLDVTVDSIKLELFTGDSDLVSVTVVNVAFVTV